MPESHPPIATRTPQHVSPRPPPHTLKIKKKEGLTKEAQWLDGSEETYLKEQNTSGVQ